MAHKLRVKPVPYIRKDNTASPTKKQYRVMCKRRGHVCTDEVFTTRREADDYAEHHWKFVSDRKKRLADMIDHKRKFENHYPGAKISVRWSPDVPSFRNHIMGMRAYA